MYDRITAFLDIFRPEFRITKQFGNWIFSPSSGEGKEALFGPLERSNRHQWFNKLKYFSYFFYSIPPPLFLNLSFFLSLFFFFRSLCFPSYHFSFLFFSLICLSSSFLVGYFYLLFFCPSFLSLSHLSLLCSNGNRTFFCSRTPRFNLSWTLYPQSCWCIIQVMHSL
jgi:hypothetical protein